MNTVRSGPATSSSLNKAWLSITGQDTWKPTDATVFSCDWTDLPDQIGGSVGHYHVVYSYQVDGTFYTGRFADYGMAGSAPGRCSDFASSSRGFSFSSPETSIAAAIPSAFNWRR